MVEVNLHKSPLRKKNKTRKGKRGKKGSLIPFTINPSRNVTCLLYLPTPSTNPIPEHVALLPAHDVRRGPPARPHGADDEVRSRGRDLRPVTTTSSGATAWRLLESRGQLETGGWTGVEAGAGVLVVAARGPLSPGTGSGVRVRAEVLVLALGAAGAGSLAGTAGYLGRRYNVHRAKLPGEEKAERVRYLFAVLSMQDLYVIGGKGR